MPNGRRSQDDAGVSVRSISKKAKTALRRLSEMADRPGKGEFRRGCGGLHTTGAGGKCRCIVDKGPEHGRYQECCIRVTNRRRAETGNARNTVMVDSSAR